MQNSTQVLGWGGEWKADGGWGVKPGFPYYLCIKDKGEQNQMDQDLAQGGNGSREA